MQGKKKLEDGRRRKKILWLLATRLCLLILSHSPALANCSEKKTEKFINSHVLFCFIANGRFFCVQKRTEKKPSSEQMLFSFFSLAALISCVYDWNGCAEGGKETPIQYSIVRQFELVSRVHFDSANHSLLVSISVHVPIVTPCHTELICPTG